jgi:hypothetical protein
VFRLQVSQESYSEIFLPNRQILKTLIFGHRQIRRELAIAYGK